MYENQDTSKDVNKVIQNEGLIPYICQRLILLSVFALDNCKGNLLLGWFHVFKLHMAEWVRAHVSLKRCINLNRRSVVRVTLGEIYIGPYSQREKWVECHYSKLSPWPHCSTKSHQNIGTLAPFVHFHVSKFCWNGVTGIVICFIRAKTRPQNLKLFSILASAD